MYWMPNNTGPRKLPSLCLRMMPGTMARLRQAAKIRRVPITDYVVEALLTRLERDQAYEPSLVRAKPEEMLPIPPDPPATAAVGEPSPWVNAWPDLKRLAAEDKAAAMEIFRELRGGRGPAPRPDILRIPEADAIEWLELNYPLSTTSGTRQIAV